MWQCDWKHSNTHVMTSFFFGSEIFNKCEKCIWKENIWTLFFKKKIIRFEKIENHVATFPYWFWFNISFFNVLISSRTCHHLMSDPFGFLIINVILKMRKNHDNFFYNNMMIYPWRKGCFKSCSWCLWKALDKEGCMGLVPWHLDLQCKSSWILNDFFTEN